MKIALVCSHGGHLTELIYLLEAFDGYDLFFVTYDNPRTRAMEYRKYLFPNFGEKPLEMFKNLPRFLSIMLKERPDVMVSNGAELAIPFFYIAKLLRIKTIFIECYTRINEPTITGKTVYPVTNLFLVLWPDMLKKYGKKAQYWGGLFDIYCLDFHATDEGKDGIFVITGMHSKGFPRLVKKIDEIAGKLDEEVVIQIGNTDYEPKNCKFFRFEKYEKIKRLMEQSRIIICQGAMTIIDALILGKSVISIPRSKEHNEIINDHQIVFSRKLEELRLTKLIENIEDLEKVILGEQVTEAKRIKVNEIFISRLKNWLSGCICRE